MEKWQQLMNELRAGRKTFDNFESEKQFGAIFIDYSMVQTKINNKYDAWHKEIMNKFASTLNDNMKSLEIIQKHYLGNNLVKVLHRRLQSSIDTTVMGFTKAGITSTTGESRHFYVHPC